MWVSCDDLAGDRLWEQSRCSLHTAEGRRGLKTQGCAARLADRQRCHGRRLYLGWSEQLHPFHAQLDAALHWPPNAQPSLAAWTLQQRCLRRTRAT